MEPQIDMPAPPERTPFRTWGLWAVVTGAVALMLVFYQVFGPMVEPKPSAGTQVGEIAGEIKRAAWRSFFGLPRPETTVEPVTVSDYLGIVAPVLGIVAILLSLISGLARENWRYPLYGGGLGVASIVFFYVWWIAILFAGVLLLVAIIENIGDIFSF